jgi:hypothetical protein
MFFNIFEEPMFQNASSGDFRLQQESACIDAGSPGVLLDPDGTLADLGVLYYYQDSPPITIDITPFNPPIQIPNSGGSFDYNILINNTLNTSQNIDIWIMNMLPNGILIGPIIGPVNLTIPANYTIASEKTQYVPDNAPAGLYTYEIRLGDYPNDVWHGDSFTFEKLGTDQGSSPGSASDWICTGAGFEEYQAVQNPDLPKKFTVTGTYPNPFNPTTVIRFNLSQAAQVRLEVFDINGRRVEVGLPLWGLDPTRQYAPGTHEIAFDGSDLPSGIYLARLQAGDASVVRKLILLK